MKLEDFKIFSLIKNNLNYIVTPQFQGVFFFFFGFYTSLSQQRNLCCNRIPLSRSCLCCARIPVARACLSSAPGFVMGNKAPLSCAVERLCRAHILIATSLPLAQCPFLVATQMNSVATWELLTMTELCRDLEFSCRNLVSTAYTSLYRNKEKSCHDIESPFLACRDRIPLSRAHLCCARPRPIVLAWPGLSHAHNVLYCNTTRCRTVVRAIIRTANPVM